MPKDSFCFTSVKDALPDKSGSCLCICHYRTGYGDNYYYYILCQYSAEPFEDVWEDTRPAGFYCYDSEVDWYAVNDVAYWLMLPDVEEIVKMEE